MQKFAGAHGILTQAWSPIGGITFYRDGSHGSTLDDPVIGAIARAHGKSPAQVMLRWGLQEGRSVIPKSTKPARIAENIDMFDFELSAEETTAGALSRAQSPLRRLVATSRRLESGGSVVRPKARRHSGASQSGS